MPKQSQQKPLLISIFKNLPFECSHQSLLISVPVFVLFQLFLRLPWVDSKERYHVHMGLLHVGNNLLYLEYVHSMIKLITYIRLKKFCLKNAIKHKY